MSVTGIEAEGDYADKEEETQGIAEVGKTGVHEVGKPKRRIIKPNYLKDYV